MCQRSWVRIPAPYTEWTFSHVFVVGIEMAGYHINWIGFDQTRKYAVTCMY